MSPPLARATDTVWTEYNKLEVLRKKNGGRAPSRHRDAPHALLGRLQTIASLRAHMATEWLHQHQKPSSLAILAEQVASEPRWEGILTTIQASVDDLQARSDSEFAWITMNAQAPRPDQWVLYFFSAIGTQVGVYRGLDEDTGLEMFSGLSGDMVGGGVTHWMPLPGHQGAVAQGQPSVRAA